MFGPLPNKNPVAAPYPVVGFPTAPPIKPIFSMVLTAAPVLAIKPILAVAAVALDIYKFVTVLPSPSKLWMNAPAEPIPAKLPVYVSDDPKA